MSRMQYLADVVSSLDRKEFGRRLKRLRLELDKTLEAMGEPAGISAATIRNLEDGVDRPQDRTLYRLMKAYPALITSSDSDSERATI